MVCIPELFSFDIEWVIRSIFPDDKPGLIRDFCFDSEMVFLGRNPKRTKKLVLYLHYEDFEKCVENYQEFRHRWDNKDLIESDTEEEGPFDFLSLTTYQAAKESLKVWRNDVEGLVCPGVEEVLDKLPELKQVDVPLTLDHFMCINSELKLWLSKEHRDLWISNTYNSLVGQEPNLEFSKEEETKGLRYCGKHLESLQRNLDKLMYEQFVPIRSSDKRNFMEEFKLTKQSNESKKRKLDDVVASRL